MKVLFISDHFIAIRSLVGHVGEIQDEDREVAPLTMLLKIGIFKERFLKPISR